MPPMGMGAYLAAARQKRKRSPGPEIAEPKPIAAATVSQDAASSPAGAPPHAVAAAPPAQDIPRTSGGLPRRRKDRKAYLSDPSITTDQRQQRISEMQSDNARRRQAYIAMHPTLTQFSPDVQAQRGQPEHMAGEYAKAGLEAPPGGFYGRSLADPSVQAPLAKIYRDVRQQAIVQARTLQRRADAKAYNIPLHLYDPAAVRRFEQAPDFNIEYLGKPITPTDPQLSKLGPSGEFTRIYDPIRNKADVRLTPKLEPVKPGAAGYWTKDETGVRISPKGTIHPEDLERIRGKARAGEDSEKMRQGIEKYNAQVGAYQARVRNETGTMKQAMAKNGQQIRKLKTEMDQQAARMGANYPELLKARQAQYAQSIKFFEDDNARLQSEIDAYMKGDTPFTKPVPPTGAMDDSLGDDVDPLDASSETDESLTPEDEAMANTPATEPLPDDYEPESGMVSEMDYVNEIVKLASDFWEQGSIYGWVERDLQQRHGMTPEQAEAMADDLFVKAGLGQGAGQAAGQGAGGQSAAGGQ